MMDVSFDLAWLLLSFSTTVDHVFMQEDGIYSGVYADSFPVRGEGQFALFHC